MLIAITKGFFSVVVDAERAGNVLVRARCKADIWNLYRSYQKRFKMSRPRADEKRDYRWRLTMKRNDFAKIAESEVRQILYFNFKDAVHGRKDQANKTEPYMKVWSALLQAQLAEGPQQQFRFTPDWMLDSAAESQAERKERRYYRDRERELFDPIL